MIVTLNFKNKLLKLQKRGYTHVASIASNHYATEYFHFESIKAILSTKTGISLSHGRYYGETQTVFYTKCPSGKVIRYQDIFKN